MNRWPSSAAGALAPPRSPETYKQAFYARNLAGRVVLIGVPTPAHDAQAVDEAIQGHSRGSVCFHAPDQRPGEAADTTGVAFSDDTMFQGGPGATGRSYSDFGTIIESTKAPLLVLPEETTVLTGHSDSTTIGAETPHLQEWIQRGH